VFGSILITQRSRRIPIQQAKHTRGAASTGGSPVPPAPRQSWRRHADHLRPVDHALSRHVFRWLHGLFPAAATIGFINTELGRGAYIYVLLEVIMIYFFAYFWTTVQFQPKEMANQLRDYGSFIPGLRPGKRTKRLPREGDDAHHLRGCAFLCIIAVIPRQSRTCSA